MWIGVYHIVVIAVAVWGLITGYRKGLFRQVGGVLGMAFGISAVRMVAPDFFHFTDEWIPQTIAGFKRGFLVETITCGIIYIVVSGFIQLCAIPIGKLVGLIRGGLLNMIAGALFRLFKYLFLVSIIYNVIADFNPEGELTRSSRQHDGNVVEEVMKIAPPILGFPDGEEVGRRQQLEDAKKIS